MLPNIKTQSAVLRKSLFNQFGLELKTHQANEIVARMLDFSDYQAMLRGIEKVSKRIFEGRVVHAVASAHYFSGEDEVCYLLGQILNLRRTRYFVVEARGSWRGIGRQNVPETVIVRPSAGDREISEYIRPAGAYQAPYLSSPANHLIASSPIFPEVLLFEHKDNERSWEILDAYIRAQPFQSGIVSTGEDNRWRMLKDASARTEYSLVYHVAISNSYATGGNSFHVKKLLQSLRMESPDSVIVAWIFEDDCASSRHGLKGRDRVIYSESGSPEEERATDSWPRVDGLGFVEPHTHEFFTGIVETLADYRVPFIRVPHYSGDKCFVSGDFTASEPTPQQVGERDGVTLDVIRQMESLDLVKAPTAL